MSRQQHLLDLIDAPDFTASQQSGRATWDERGNSIWEWQTAPGVFSRDISSQQLQALQATELQVVDESNTDVQSSPSAWTRRALPRKVSRDIERIMPMRGKSESPTGFDAFIKRLSVPA